MRAQLRRREADTFVVVGRAVWIGAIVVALLAVVGGRYVGESAPFCSDFRRIDKALGALRDAKATGEFDTVPDLVDDVADVYEGIVPPPALLGDWTAAVTFFRLQAENARSLISRGTSPRLRRMTTPDLTRRSRTSPTTASPTAGGCAESSSHSSRRRRHR